MRERERVNVRVDSCLAGMHADQTHSELLTVSPRNLKEIIQREKPKTEKSFNLPSQRNNFKHESQTEGASYPNRAWRYYTSTPREAKQVRQAIWTFRNVKVKVTLKKKKGLPL